MTVNHRVAGSSPATPAKEPMDYDFEHLRREYLDALRVPSAPPWLEVTLIPPTPYEPVLLAGPIWKHSVGYLDPTLSGWIVNEKLVEFATFPHWMPLPRPPFYDGEGR